MYHGEGLSHDLTLWLPVRQSDKNMRDLELFLLYSKLLDLFERPCYGMLLKNQTGANRKYSHRNFPIRDYDESGVQAST